MEYFYPTIDEVLIAYARVMGIPLSRCPEYIHDRNLLESALARPRNAALYEDATLTRQAATLLWGLIKNHPFQDGNKRMAWLVAQAFLRGNGAEITADLDQVFNHIIRIADGVATIDEVEAWMSDSVSPRKAEG